MVCGHRTGPSPYRLPPDRTNDAREDGPPRAEIGLGGGTRIGIETEQVSVGGAPSNRAMVRLRVPIGGRRR